MQQLAIIPFFCNLTVEKLFFHLIELSDNVMSKISKFLTLILVFVIVSSSLYQLGRQINWDLSNKRYTTAFRYKDLARASSLYGETQLELIKKFDQDGKSLVLFKTNLATTSKFSVSRTVEDLKDAGISRGVEIQNIQLADEDEFRRLLEYLKEMEPQLLVLRGLGPVPLPSWLTKWIEKNKVVLGTVEFRDKEISRKLTKKFGVPSVRLHRIFDKEVGTLTEVERKARYVRAVKERNIGVIEYRLSLNVEPDKKANLLESVQAELARSGYNVASVSNVKGAKKEISSPFWLILTLVTGSIGLIILLFLPSRFSNSSAILMAFILLGTGGAIGLTLYPVLTRQSAALLLALAAPVAGLKLVKGYGRSFRPESGFSAVFLDFVGLCIFSTFSGVVVSGILFDQSFLIKLHQFRGVKMALFFPLLLLLALAIYLGELRISKVRFDYKKALAAVLFLGLFLFLLLRSGNFSFLSSTDLEEAIRRGLDRAFLVRPRFKEFLLGHPSLIAWLYLAGHGEDDFQFCKLGLLLVGFMGQVSIINTFVHVHTPITISLIRTANGMIGGLILGAIILTILVGGEFLWKLKKE